MIDYNHYNGISYFFKWLGAWLTCWSDRLIGDYASYSMEIKIAIGVIVAAVITIVFVLFLILRKAYLEWRMLRMVRKIKRDFGTSIEQVLREGQNLTMENVGNRLKIKLTSKRMQRTFCLVLYNCLIDDEVRVKSENDGDPDIIVDYKRFNIKNLHQILNYFGLAAFLEKEIDHGFLSRKVRVVNMMGTFRQEINLWLINAVLESGSPCVRRQATHAAILSNGDTDLGYYESDFFDNNSCLKDEIELGYTLYRLQVNRQGTPDLARLALLQKNANTQSILVRLMRRFDTNNRQASCAQLENLFTNSTNNELTGEIALTWGYLGYRKGEKLMLAVLPTQSEETKIKLMHALTCLKSEQALDVFCDIFKHAVSDVLQFEALRCIYCYGDGEGSRFRQLECVCGDAYQHFFEFFIFKDAKEKDKMRFDKEVQAYKPLGNTAYNVPQGSFKE